LASTYPLIANPVVSAALARIQRAHHPVVQDDRQAYPVSVSAAAAGASDSRSSRTTAPMQSTVEPRTALTSLFDDRPAVSHAPDVQDATTNYPVAESALPSQDLIPFSEPEPAAENGHGNERAGNLVMVPPLAVAVAEPEVVQQTIPPPVAAALPQAAPERPKPKRIISDDSTDPALNYLDKIGLTHSITETPTMRAPMFLRLMAGLIDILGACFLSVPFAALIELRNDNWREPRIAGLMAGAVIIVMFIYLTVSTALTGRTLGLKISSLRVIDARTGLIPTGKQAAGRAIVYILSLATAGIGFLMALARGEGKTVHDRLSGTVVVRN